MAKYNFRITVSSDFNGYMAYAKETSSLLSDRNSSYRNSGAEALSELLAKLHDLTYGDFTYTSSGG